MGVRKLGLFLILIFCVAGGCWTLYKGVALSLAYSEPPFSELTESSGLLRKIYCRSEARGVSGALHLYIDDGDAILVFHDNSCSEYSSVEPGKATVRAYWHESFGRHFPFELYLNEDQLLSYEEEAPKLYAMRKSTIGTDFVLAAFFFIVGAIVCWRLVRQKASDDERSH